MTADHAGQTGGEREVCECGHRARDHDDGFDCLVLAPPGRGRVYCPCSSFRLRALSRPIPVPGQAAREEFTPAPQNVKSGPGNSRGREQAREAAVEAVARVDQLPKVWRDAAWAYRLDGVRDYAEALERCADDLVAALSVAPGQESAHEWNCPSCGATTRARMADQDDDHGDCFEVCQGHPR